jgi:hypothetical protein
MTEAGARPKPSGIAEKQPGTGQDTQINSPQTTPQSQTARKIPAVIRFSAAC